MTKEIINSAKSTSFLATIGGNADRNLTYTIQSTNLGGATLQPAAMPARWSNIPYPGDKVQFNDLAITFLLDEDISQWIEINRWMFEASKGVSESNVDELMTYIEITILDRRGQPSVRIIYNNCHPISVGDIEYTLVGDEETLACQATFVYSDYKIVNVKTGDEIVYGR